MKKKFIFITLIFAALVSFSCTRTGGTIQDSPLRLLETGTPSESENNVSGIQNPGHVLRVNAGFYSFETDTGTETDRTRWIASLSLGESIMTGETRRGTFAGDGRVYEFIRIRRDNGNEGYTFANQVALGGRLAVVIDERANLFRAPRAVDVSSTVLSRRTVVVSFPDTENNGFIQISGYDPESQFYVRQDNNHIRILSISGRDADIQSSILLQTALATRENEAVRRAALLESALIDYPGSVFNQEINLLVNPNTVSVVQTIQVPIPFMTVTVDDTELRDLPDMVVGSVINRLKRGESVTAMERTTVSSVINGQSGYWFRITFPAEGWIFGANLE
jgi:hypothetical protein